MANKNNSRSPKGRFLTLRLRLIVNSTILEKTKQKINSYRICGQQRPRSAYADLGLCLLFTYAKRDPGFRYFETVQYKNEQ